MKLFYFYLSKALSRMALLGSVKVRREAVRTRPVIFVANHPSTLDPFFVIGSLPHPACILITEYIFKLPVIGPILRASGHIKVEKDRGRQAFARARDALLAGRSLLMFPEGSVSRDKTRVEHIHTGAIRLAMETHAPVVPIGIYLNPDKIRQHEVRFGNDREIGNWYANGMYGITYGNEIHFVGDTRNRDEVMRQCMILRGSMEKQIGESSRLISRLKLKHTRTYNLLYVLVYFFRMHFAYTNWINS